MCMCAKLNPAKSKSASAISVEFHHLYLSEDKENNQNKLGWVGGVSLLANTWHRVTNLKHLCPYIPNIT